jgi:hypothetical protein
VASPPIANWFEVGCFNMVSELDFQRLLDKTLIIGCLVVCHLSASCFVVCFDPYIMDPLFISPLVGQRSPMKGSFRACPTMVNYLQKLVYESR